MPILSRFALHELNVILPPNGIGGCPYGPAEKNAIADKEITSHLF